MIITGFEQEHELDLTVYDENGNRINTSVLKRKYDEIYYCIEKGLDDFYFCISCNKHARYIHFKIEVPDSNNKTNVILRKVGIITLNEGEKISGRYGK